MMRLDEPSRPSRDLLPPGLPSCGPSGSSVRPAGRRRAGSTSAKSGEQQHPDADREPAPYVRREDGRDQRYEYVDPENQRQPPSPTAQPAGPGESEAADQQTNTADRGGNAVKVVDQVGLWAHRGRV